MMDGEKLDLILQEIQNVKSEITEMKSDIAELKMEMSEVKSEIAKLKTEMSVTKMEIGIIKTEITELQSKITVFDSEIAEINSKVKAIGIHIENDTDRNIRLLAENFVELTNKLNQAISVADKNLAYEVKVNYLSEEMEKLKREVAEIKKRIA